MSVDGTKLVETFAKKQLVEPSNKPVSESPTPEKRSVCFCSSRLRVPLTAAAAAACVPDHALVEFVRAGWSMLLKPRTWLPHCELRPPAADCRSSLVVTLPALGSVSLHSLCRSLAPIIDSQHSDPTTPSALSLPVRPPAALRHGSRSQARADQFRRSQSHSHSRSGTLQTDGGTRR